MRDIKIDFNNIHLVLPCTAYMHSYREAIKEYRHHKVEDFAYPKVGTRREIAAFLRKADHFRRGINMPKGYVPSSAYWLVDGQNYLGSGDVRHFLNDNLRRLGGNIGYSIRPGAWRNGLGTLQLALLLVQAKKLRIYKPLVTCFDGNTASARIIEKNGGILLHKLSNSFGGQQRLTRIYEIDLTSNTEYAIMDEPLKNQ